MSAVLETHRPRQSNSNDGTADSAYSAFDQLDGQHPWRDAMPHGYIDYPARIIADSKVAYFNFALARDMGLLSTDHPDEIPEPLHQKLVETFALRILNEYDHILGQHVPVELLRSNPYLATRYLQLQHSDTTGRTSGDGRSIWNGVYCSGGMTWDVSSWGTGVTALAPGAVEADRPLETGSEEFGYGCGLAELDEVFASALLSEIFFRRGLHTERVLAILDIGNGHGIGVRVARNLMRPAHCFTYLRQNDRDGLERALSYLIERQHANGDWAFAPQHPRKWDLLLDTLCDAFAALAAFLDVEHIFVWPDWDGDNVLADAGIIDYGCVRQFGLRHDEYRYDDVQRFSPALRQQPEKLKLCVQSFAQAIDYVRHGARRPLESFGDHKIVARYWQQYSDNRMGQILYRLGFDAANASRLLAHEHDAVAAFADLYDAIESRKTQRPVERVSDGVNRQPLFNIRRLLYALPGCLLEHHDFEAARLPTDTFFSLLFARATNNEDRLLAGDIEQQAVAFQEGYKQLVAKASGGGSTAYTLRELQRRSQIINADDRATGDAITTIVEKILAARRSGLAVSDVNQLMRGLIEYQCLDPDQPRPGFENQLTSGIAEDLWKQVRSLLKIHSEDL